MDYIEIIKGDDFKAIEKLFTDNKPALERTHDEVASQYKIAKHDVFDESKRPKKTIKKDSGDTDDKGNPILVTTQVEVARVGLPFQELIVERRVGFMLTEPVKIETVAAEDTTQEQELVDLIDYIQNDNKMDYRNKEVARRLMSECEVAELWYFIENKDPKLKGKFTLKMKILSPDLGDELYPLFDTTGDMIAFGRKYKIKEDKKEIEHFDIYTAEFEYKYIKRDDWALDTEQSPNPVPNTVGKIMAVYYSQPVPEWDKVQSMISRFEDILSNHADTNDYFGSPILTVQGEIMGYAQKGETGKILQLENNAQANYLALASEPQSIKMEIDNLEKFIYAMSQTPNITFEEMKSMGPLSGVALEMMFLDAHMAVATKEETFGIGLQRRLNLIKTTIGKVIDTSKGKIAETLQIKPVITPYMPKNVTELVENLSLSVSNGILSRETAIAQNPYVSDIDVEVERVRGQDNEELAAAGENTKEKKVPPTE